MARTKQTARYCYIAQKVPRKQLIAQKVARKSAPFSSSSNHIPIQQQQVSVNNQQFSIKFDDQIKCQSEAITGDIITCKNCQAILTIQSKMYEKKQYEILSKSKDLNDQQKQKFIKNSKNNNDKIWICEFCLNHNKIDQKYQIPIQQNPCFLIEKCKKRSKSNKKVKQQDQNNQILIFCIDISTSMTLQVAGNKSRLDTLKQAVIQQIDRLKIQKQHLKVGIVLFGSLVFLIGDGSKKQTQLNANLYNDFDAIIKQAQKIQNFCKPLSKSYKKLRQKIQDLSYHGSTALGPALLTSIQIASKGGIGSKVIICTDGQANTGVGSSNFGGWSFSTNSQSNMKEQSDFYQKAAQFAKKKGVSVSCLSLKGDKCNLKEISKLSLATSGSLLKIDPINLGTQFSKITKQQIIGTESNLKIKVNKIFEIISDNKQQISSDKTTLTRNFGNFSADTQLTFQFNVLDKQHASKIKTIDLDLFKKQKVPMQIKLQYIGRDGNKYMQIFTDWRNLTQNEKDIYDGANYALFTASVLQRASNKIRNKQLNEAGKIIKGYWSLVEEKFGKEESKVELKKYGDQVKQLEKILKSKTQKTQGKGKILTRKAPIASKSQSKGKATKQTSRSRSRDKKTKIKKSKVQQSESDNQVLSSDEEQQVLCKYMRARS